MTSLEALPLAGIAEQGEVAVETTPSISAGAEFGGHEARLRFERQLVRKLDTRLSILVVMFILDYVGLRKPLCSRSFTHARLPFQRRIELTLGEF